MTADADDFLVVIPARLRSSRLPGKPLIVLGGKTVLQRTYEQVLLACSPERIVVATDSDYLRRHCETFGADCILTSSGCCTGTDRVAEVALSRYARRYVNVQGDEPFINPHDITTIIRESSKNPSLVYAGFAVTNNVETIASQSVPKLTRRVDGSLMYISRLAIPGSNGSNRHTYLKQVCIYSYGREILLSTFNNNMKTPNERVEDIELLRFLEQGIDVQMIELEGNSFSIDLPQDVIKAQNLIRGESQA